MNPDILIFGCAALLVAFIFSNICAYKFGRYMGWMEVFQKYALYEKASMTLKEGETLIAVVDTKKDIYFFIGNNGKPSKNYE